MSDARTRVRDKIADVLDDLPAENVVLSCGSRDAIADAILEPPVKSAHPASSPFTPDRTEAAS